MKRRKDPILAALDRAAASFTAKHDAIQAVAGDILGHDEMFTCPYWPADYARAAVLALVKMAPPRILAEYRRNAKKALAWVDEFELFVKHEREQEARAA